jgi:hypothetical protein
MKISEKMIDRGDSEKMIDRDDNVGMQEYIHMK